MLGNVEHTRANDGHGDIVPRHATIFGLAQFVLVPVLYFLEIHDSVVVEVLTWPDFFGNTFWMHISKGMLPGVPAAKAQIQSADESHGVVNDDEFFVVRPVNGHVGSVLEHIVIWVPHDPDVAVTRRALGAKRIERMLRVARVASQSRLDFFIDANIDLDTSLGLPLENLVQTIFLLVIRGPSQKQFRGEPPIAYIDRFLGLFERNRDGPKIVTSVDVPLDEISFALREIRLESMRLANSRAFLITALLVFFVMAVVSVELFSTA